MKITNRSVLLNTSYQIAGKVVISFFGFVATAILARYLGVTQFGEYNLVFTIASFATLLGDFGLATYVIREIASKRKSKDFISEVFSLRLYIAIFTLVVIVGGVNVLPYTNTVKLGIIIASLSGFFLLFSSVFWAFYQGQLQFGKVVAIQVITGAISLALSVMSVVVGLSFLWVVGVSLVANFFALVLSIGEFRKEKFFVSNITRFRSIIVDVWPFGVGLIFSVLYFKIDTVMLSFYFNPSLRSDVSYYSIAYKIFEVLLVFAGYFTSTLFPIFAKPWTKEEFRAIFRKYLWYSLGLAGLGGIGMYFTAPLLISILGGNEYLPATLSVQILSLSLFASILAGFFLNIAIAGNKQILLLKFAALAIVFNIIINIAVLPKFSYLGASVTTVLTQFFILISYIITTIIVFNEKRATISR